MPSASTFAPRAGSRVQPIWPRLRKWIVPVFGLLVLGLLLSHAHKVDWAGAWEVLRRYPHGVLALALLLAIASHMLYGCFDLVGRAHTLHGLALWRTWAIAVTSYAFNLNLGSLVGGVALRARLYAKAGLDEGEVAQVVGISLATNWLGYALLAGSLFAAGVIDPPAKAPIGEHALRLVGVGLMLLAAGYVALCGLSRQRSLRVRGRDIHLPGVRLALVQLALSATNWALMGGVIWVLLRGQVGYASALGVLMAASIVGVITPIPAGLGVLEAVYLALLSGQVRQSMLMGAVLAYRALYYLIPLAVGVLLYLFLERHAARHPATSAEGAGAG